VSDRCYRLSRQLARGALSAFLRLHVWGKSDAIEAEGAAVLVANHISHFDPVLLSIAFSRPIDWMTTEEFYANPLGGPFLRALNTFPVDRSRPDQRALRRGIERLQAGRTVGMFPEGGIRAGPTSILGGAPGRRGASALARLANVPIIPSVIFGSDRLYARRSWIPLPPRLRVWIGIAAPFSLSHEDEESGHDRLTNALRELGAATVAHFGLTTDDLPATPQHRKGRDRLPNEPR
jgi:1-acyl-sn-glycerol-3-phosphate acyltransferase